MTKFHYANHMIGDLTMEWCNVCKRDTKRMIQSAAKDSKAGIAGPCLEHTAQILTQKQITARVKRRRERQNPRLFEM